MNAKAYWQDRKKNTKRIKKVTDGVHEAPVDQIEEHHDDTLLPWTH